MNSVEKLALQRDQMAEDLFEMLTKGQVTPRWAMIPAQYVRDNLDNPDENEGEMTEEEKLAYLAALLPDLKEWCYEQFNCMPGGLDVVPATTVGGGQPHAERMPPDLEAGISFDRLSYLEVRLENHRAVGWELLHSGLFTSKEKALKRIQHYFDEHSAIPLPDWLADMFMAVPASASPIELGGGHRISIYEVFVEEYK